MSEIKSKITAIIVDKLGVDAAGYSAHKMYGPQGVGALFVRKGRADLISHGLSGGGAVDAVLFNGEVLSKSPNRFEIGTQNLTGFVHWGYSVGYLESIGMEKIVKHDDVLGHYLMDEFLKLQDKGLIELYGPQEFRDKVPVFTYNVGSWRNRNHADVASKLWQDYDVCNRNGCFCAHPAMFRLMGVPLNEARVWYSAVAGGKNPQKPGAVRSSPGINNHLSDVYAQIMGVKEIAEGYR